MKFKIRSDQRLESEKFNKFMIIVMILLVSGCGLGRSQDNNLNTNYDYQTNEISTIQAGEVISSQTPTLTIEPSMTMVPTMTLTPTPRPTKTPIPPTLTFEEALEYVNFLEGGEDCQIPCWNGLTPGESTDDDIPILWETLGLNIDEAIVFIDGQEYRIYENYYRNYNSPLYGINVNSNNNTIKLITLIFLETLNPFPYTFTELISSMGLPTEMYFDYGSEGPEQLYYFLMIFEENHIAYFFSNFTQNGNICSSSFQELNVFLFHNRDDLPAVENIIFSRYVSPIEEWGVSIEEVMNELITGDRCMPLLSIIGEE